MPDVKEKANNPSLDYAKIIGLRASDKIELSNQVIRGFPFKAFVTLMKTMHLTNQQLADLVQISERTLTRRRKEGKLKSDESERLLRFSRLFTMALELFDGDRSAAQDWLSTKNRALQGQSPLEESRTEIGAREVENLIIRLEHGVIS
jgi:putative toxin-antitoxin system antitoxin component (TIGR02293 family)